MGPPRTVCYTQKHLFFVLLYKSSDGRLGNYDYLVKKTVRQHQLSAPLVSPWLDMSSLAAGELAPVDMGGFGGIRPGVMDETSTP